MYKRWIALGLLVAALALSIYWIADGSYLFTADRVQVAQYDPLFDTTTTAWVDEFHIGLLPWIAPSVGALVLGAGVLLWFSRRGNRTDASRRDTTAPDSNAPPVHS